MPLSCYQLAAASGLDALVTLETCWDLLNRTSHHEHFLPKQFITKINACGSSVSFNTVAQQ
jgi:hypothetical protein